MSTNMKKKAIMPLIAMVLVSVIALSGVTYAWFTTSNTASVNNLEVKVESATGIQISLDAANWSSSFDASDIIAANIDTNQIPNGTRVFPVSTAGNVSGGVMSMFLGNLKDDNTIDISTLVDGANNNYIAFDLYFKMSSATTVTIDGSTVTESGTAATIESVQSARVAFVDLGSATTATAVKANTTLDTDTGVIIWDPVTGAGTYNGLSAIGDSVATENGIVPAGSNAVQVNTVALDNVELKLQAGYNKIRIYIWMEGQDPDCVNDASGGTFVTKLKFNQPSPDDTTGE